jgi:hypothetical protein
MEEERIVRAMTRIEAAVRRIEAASAYAPAAPNAHAAPHDSDLAERHQRLRSEAWAALAELDSLIETIDA